ncbi:MAG: LysM peptidoglycan-binding domain-containing protein [Oceanococcaceae bacterium]
MIHPRSVLRLCCASLLFLLGLAQAKVPDDPFPRPPELATAIAFWADVYAVYSVHDTVFHHPDHLDVIYKVLNLREAAESMADNEAAFQALRRELIRNEKEKIQQQLRALAAVPAGANPPAALLPLHSQMERVPGKGPEKYLRAAEWVRSQRGLKEKFAEAVAESGRYMPYIEKVFADAGLPRLLSRLPFVESSFNLAAYSRSGAAGIWQFMPGSARQYMRYDEVADQRRDPWFSTHAAAGHLSDDYALLQDWPLAVTAYNYGRNGLARAREETGMRSLVELIAKWDGPRWGFAGKNFYAEFLAALQVEQNAELYFGPTVRRPLTRFDEVEILDYLEYATVQALSGLEDQRFRELNPSFSEPVRQGSLLVPKGQIIRVPPGQGAALMAGLQRLPSRARFSQQREYFARYRVQRGDSLSAIAERHRSSVREIMQLNGLRSASFIRIGQVLKIPTRGGSGVGGSRLAEAAVQTSVHQVASGETLWGIARRYGTSVSTLLADNDIGSASRLQVGQRLKVRGGSETQVRSHRVSVGETLSGIADRYGTSVAQLKRDNGIRDADVLRVGQSLKVIASRDNEPGQASVRHRISSGQTLDGIARRYGVSTRALIQHNRISDPNRIQIGQWLTIPGT